MCALVLLTGCYKKSSTDVTSVAEGINIHPIVALVPVIDSSKSDLPWNVSEELSDLIFRRLAKQDKFYLTSPQKVTMQVKRVNSSQEPFSLDLTWIRRAFSGSEFAVFVELFEHVEKHRIEQLLPVSHVNLKESSADLNISVRVRAVDLRGPYPKIALQEIIHETHHIPRQFTRENFYQVSWKNENFGISPLGIAHDDLVKTIASRLEEYILRAKGD